MAEIENLKFGLVIALPRCPHCGIAAPNMNQVFAQVLTGALRPNGTFWAVYKCNSCGSAVLMRSSDKNDGTIEKMYPSMRSPASELPPQVQKYLQQAYDTLSAPDAAAVMAGSAVDAMLKDKGLEKGTLYERIARAVSTNLLTKDMGDWANSVRLGSNRPRHADKEKPHVSKEEAVQSVEFAEALGHFLYVLSSRIAKGIEGAKEAEKK